MLVSISTCGFPEIGIPPTNHQFLDGIFHEINHPAIVGTTMYGYLRMGLRASWWLTIENGTYRSIMIKHDTSSTAQGGGGSFKNRKPIGEIDCCESRMAERIH